MRAQADRDIAAIQPVFLACERALRFNDLSSTAQDVLDEMYIELRQLTRKIQAFREQFDE